MICLHCLSALSTTSLSSDSDPLPVCVCPQSTATLTQLSETDTLTVMSLHTLQEADRLVRSPNDEREPTPYWCDNEESEIQLPPPEKALRYFGHRSRTGIMLYWADWGGDHRASLGRYEDVWLVVEHSPSSTQPDLIIDSGQETIEPCLKAAYTRYALQQLQAHAHTLKWNDDVIHCPHWHGQDLSDFDDLDLPGVQDLPWLTICRQGLPDWHLTRAEASRITVHESQLCLDEQTDPISLSFYALTPANTRSLSLSDTTPWQQCLAFLARFPYVVVEKQSPRGHQMVTLNSDAVLNNDGELQFTSDNAYPNESVTPLQQIVHEQSTIYSEPFRLIVHEQSTIHSEWNGPSSRASLTVTDLNGTRWTLTWFESALQALNTPLYV